MDLKLLRDTPPWERPDDTAKQVLAVLRDPRAAPSDRLLAAEVAGEYTVINDELAETLIAIVGRDGDTEELRGQAAISLGTALEYVDTDLPAEEEPEDVVISEAVFHRACAELQRLFQDEKIPKLVRRRILEASVRAPRDWHEAAVRAALASNDEEWRLTAVFCMQHVRGFEREILAALESRNIEIRFEAIRAAGQWGLAEAWPDVLAILTDRKADKGLLLAAIAAVATIRPTEAEGLLSHLEESDDDEIAAAAADALAESMPAVEGAFDDEDDDDLDDDDPPSSPNDGNGRGPH